MRPERLLVLLRGINVGGRHPLPMPGLRALFAELGCTGVDTYIQSGNLVCTAHPSLTAATISTAVAERFGFPVPVALRTAQELNASIQANPFAQAGAQASLDTLHTVFLEAPLPPAPLKSLEAKRLGQEALAAIGRELFLYLPHGFGRSKLALACTAPSLPGNPTVRNWKTVLQLQGML